MSSLVKALVHALLASAMVALLDYMIGERTTMGGIAFVLAVAALERTYQKRPSLTPSGDEG